MIHQISVGIGGTGKKRFKTIDQLAVEVKSILAQEKSLFRILCAAISDPTKKHIEKMLRKHEFLFSGKEAYEMGFATKLGIPKIEFKVTGVWTKIGHKVFPPPVG